MFGLHDIPDPGPLLPGISLPWWTWLLLGFVLAGATFALIQFLARASGEPLHSDKHYRDSREALELFRSSLDELSIADVATRASLVLRHYLVLTLDEPVLYETHEEFLLRSDALQDLPQGARARLTPLLSELASAKYGPSRIDASASKQLIDDTLRTLQGIESTREVHVA